MASNLLSGSLLDPVLPEILSFLSCRKCPNVYTFALPNDEIVTIFCGKRPNIPYKALSYVCSMESLPGIPSQCQNCREMQTISISSMSRFNQMMQFVGGGNSVFLDILSINQDDPEGLMSEVLVMGDTYKHASIISVFLPAEDEPAYWILKDLATVSRIVVAQRHGFGFPYRAQPVMADAPQDPDILASRYIELVEKWSSNIKRWKYWKRAWTFQEWAVASEIEATFEGATPDESIVCIKKDISGACDIVCHYYMQLAKTKDMTSGPPRTKGECYIPLTKEPGNLPELHATLLQKEESFLSNTDLSAPMPYLHHQMEERERTGQFLNTIRSLFPFQDFLVADSEDDLDIQRQKTYLISSIDSGTNITLPSQPTADSEMITLRASLSLALNALGTSDRECYYEADKVVCWTSMCGIGYEYCKYDAFAVALHKAVSQMRKRGLRIFNYLANTTGAETDLKFLDYAPSQKQCNAISKGFMFGGSVFVGRVDTCFHLKCALEQDGSSVVLEKKAQVCLQRVQNSEVVATVPPTNTDEVLSVFRTILTGKPDKQTTDVLLNIEETLHSIPHTQLMKKLLVTVSIEIEDRGAKYNIDTWAIVPCGVDFSKIFVARESLNGTLVITTSMGDDAKVIAYLTMTHQKYGTYLLKSEENGRLDVVFKKEEKTPAFDELGLLGLDEEMSKLLGAGGWGSLAGMFDPVLNATIFLDDRLALVV